MLDLKERRSIDVIKKERLFVDSIAYLKEVFNSISTVTLVLNETRQILFVSNNFLEMLHVDSDNALIGSRPGEVISCIHASESPYGCNNSAACKYCGALQAVQECMLTGKKSIKEARITSQIGDKVMAWDLSVTAVPLEITNHQFYIVTLTDISSEKRKKQLERIFIHDLINSAGGISGLLEIIEYEEDENMQRKFIEVINTSSKNLLEQILSYKHILSAEAGELEVKKSYFVSTEIIKESVDIVANNKSLNANIKVDPSAESLVVHTDRLLLSRILVNMIKNAVEAENDKDSTVEAGSVELNGNVRFWVRNNKVIPDNIQKQIFQRSFSTKGANRGLGTYSIRLLGENYMKCKVGFISNETDRTMFYIDMPLLNIE